MIFCRSAVNVNIDTSETFDITSLLQPYMSFALNTYSYLIIK
jgi:hypothetical protein